MATTTRTKTSKATTGKAPQPDSGRCGLALRINGEPYRVRPLPTDFGGIKAFRLTRSDGEYHDIDRHVHVCECICGDFVFRREGLDPAGCKHVRACQACGLL